MNAHNTYKKIISDTNRVKGNVHNEGTHYHVHRYYNFLYLTNVSLRNNIWSSYILYKLWYQLISMNSNAYVLWNGTHFIPKRNHINWKCNISSLGISRNVLLTHSKTKRLHKLITGMIICVNDASDGIIESTNSMF